MTTTFRLPVLMYHKVGAPVHTPADRFLNMPTAVFAKHMRFLKRLGYRAVTLAEASGAIATGAPLPERPFVVTFDDGYRCVAEQAAPILAGYGWPATLYAPTAWVGRTNGWNVETGHPVLPLLDWPDLAALQSNGWEIGGHTRTHPHLAWLDEEGALAEISGCFTDLCDRLGSGPRSFCYPFGDLRAATPPLVRRAGFVSACTTHSGIARPGVDPYLIPRVKLTRDGLIGLIYRIWVRPHLP